MIVEGFNLAHQLGCVFWGVNQNYDPISYQQFKPITLTQCVLGPFSAHLWHDLLYDERLPLAEDYDFSLQVLQKYKKILRYNRFATYCRHNDNPGGVVAYRTNRLEIENCKLIMRKWGENVIKYKLPPTKPTDVLNARVHVPIKGV